jgi:hypothetical protein
MNYTENYIKAIYKSKRKDLIENIEKTLPINVLPIEYITLEKAISSIKNNLLSIKYVRRELQNTEEFITSFIEELRYYGDTDIPIPITASSTIKNIFTAFKESTIQYLIIDRLLNENMILSDDIKLFIKLNF